MNAVAPLPLTRRQKECYDAIVGLITALGRSPTRDELSNTLGYRGRGRTQQLLVFLKQRGLIDWEPRRACSLTVLSRSAGFQLPAELQRQLELHCAETGDRPLDVIADAVAHHLDNAGPRFEVPDLVEGGGERTATFQRALKRR